MSDVSTASVAQVYMRMSQVELNLPLATHAMGASPTTVQTAYCRCENLYLAGRESHQQVSEGLRALCFSALQAY